MSCPEEFLHLFIRTRVMDDGTVLTVAPLTFGRARLTIGRDWTGYDQGY